MTARAWAEAALLAALLAALVAGDVSCANVPASGAGEPSAGMSAGTSVLAADTTRPGWVPAGFGSLRQDDVALQLELRDVRLKAIPLDETVIRLLSPDSYRALRGIVESQRTELGRLATLHQQRHPSVWYLSFHGLAAEARFNPRDLSITSAGRELRPLELVPLTAGFGEQRLQPRETQTALALFEDGVDLTQPLTISFGTARDASSWGAIIRTLERERALVRSRASAGRTP